MSPAAEKEEVLRAEVAGIVQRILLLLNASNCLAPCVRWYTQQLVFTTESWCNVDRSDPGFPVPSSLAGYADRGFSFHEKCGNVSPKKKGTFFKKFVSSILTGVGRMQVASCVLRVAVASCELRVAVASYQWRVASCD